MKYLIVLLLLTTTLFAAPCQYTITAQPYRFSTYFEMNGPRYEGRAIKNAISVRTTYDLYDDTGTYVAQGICRLLSTGTFATWARTIDVYDYAGNTIGLIEGRFLTTAKASYNFYDADNNLLACAYLNLDCSNFMVEDSKGRMIANLKRHFVDGTLDYWDVHLYDRDSLNLHLFKIFSTFAIDHQQYFKAE